MILPPFLCDEKLYYMPWATTSRSSFFIAYSFAFMLSIGLEVIVAVCGITPECLQWCREF